MPRDQDPQVPTGIEEAAFTKLALPAVKLAIEQGGRPGIAKLKAILAGKTLTVIGPPESGKTTFLDYVRYGVFQPAGPTEPTLAVQRSKDFKLKVGEHQTLVVSIKTAVDTPGEGNPHQLADAFFELRPHALVIMLDVSAPLDDPKNKFSSAPWLRNFCVQAEQRALGVKAKKIRLRSVVVALNKADLVSEQELKQCEKAYKQIMGQHWKIAAGPSGGIPAFRKCIAVANDEGTQWVDAILVHVAKKLSEQQ
jgi:putative ribosome biogenesis GTPase RsgA